MKKIKINILGYYSSDIPCLPKWIPDGVEQIFFPLDITIGKHGQRGGDIFSVLVCSPEALRLHGFHLKSGRHTWVVLNYDWNEIDKSLHVLVSKCTASSWEDACTWLCRYFQWEYEDYAEG